MFELDFHLGPLHLTIRLANPAADGGEYSDLTGDYELAPADEHEDEPDDRIGFRGP